MKKGDRHLDRRNNGACPLFGRRPSIRIILAAFGLAAAGCAGPEAFRSPVSRFESGVNATAAAVGPCFAEMNRLEAETRLHEAAAQRKDWDAVRDLRPVFPPETIRLRLDALSLVARYARLLDDLASSKAAGELEKDATAFRDDVGGLLKTAGSLAKGSDAGAVETLSGLVGPFTTLVEVVGKVLIEIRLNGAIREGILAGERPIAAIVDLLGKDAETATTLKEADLSAMLAARLRLYNEARKKASPAEVVAMIEEIGRLNDVLQAIRAARIGSLFREMREAHAALAKFAREGRPPRNAAELAGRIDVFAEHAKLVGEAVRAARTIRRSP